MKGNSPKLFGDSMLKPTRSGSYQVTGPAKTKGIDTGEFKSIRFQVSNPTKSMAVPCANLAVPWRFVPCTISHPKTPSASPFCPLARLASVQSEGLLQGRWKHRTVESASMLESSSLSSQIVKQFPKRPTPMISQGFFRTREKPAQNPEVVKASFSHGQLASLLCVSDPTVPCGFLLLTWVLSRESTGVLGNEPRR